MDEKLMKSFAGTFLDGFFELKDCDYIEPALKKTTTEVVISKMWDAEKRIFTLIIKKYGELIILAPTFGLNEYNLGILLKSESESLLDKVGAEAERQYEEQELDFPFDSWKDFIKIFESYNMLFVFLNSLIYTRLMPKYFCPSPILRAGFLIVKDGFEAIEDDGSFEDEEKIINQNFFFN